MKNTHFQFLAQLMIVCFAPIAVWAQSYTMTTIAGTSRLRDNTPAITVPIRAPWGLVADDGGNIYFADGPDHRVRRVGADGRITTIAGTGVPGYSGDNGPAINARLDAPRGLALDQGGNLYIGDYFNNVVRKVVLATGVITTIAGNGNYTFAGDGGPATQAALDPDDIAVDRAGNIYIADYTNHRVRKITIADGIIRTIAGTGTAGDTGDGAAALQATLTGPRGISVDVQNAVYFVDYDNDRVRKIDQTTGKISAFAGSGVFSTSGDNIAAASAALDSPYATTVEANGDVLIALSSTIHRVTVADGKIHRVAGTASYGFGGDGGAGLIAKLAGPSDVLATASGDILISDWGNGRVRRLRAGNIQTIAGTSIDDNITATAAFLNQPDGVVLDGKGGLLISDTWHNRVRSISNGIIRGVLGSGFGFSTANDTYTPEGLTRDLQGNVFLADWGNDRVLRIAVDGTSSVFAGGNGAGFAGDLGLATSAQMNGPLAVALDTAGNVYIADGNNCLIRMVDKAGIISSVAGSGVCSLSGSNGPATAAAMQPEDLAIDSTNNLYLTEPGNHVVRKINLASKVITVVAGTGTAGYSGDGGAAQSAKLNSPNGVALDAAGNLYIADSGNNRVRVVRGGTITTIAGSGNYTFDSEVGPALAVAFRPVRLAVDTDNLIYVTDTFNDRIRRLAVAVASKLEISSGDGLQGTPGQQLILAAKVADSTGIPVTGVTVNFIVASGTAQVSTPAVQSGLDGIASVPVTLGSAQGAATVTATMAGAPSVTFHLTIGATSTCSLQRPVISSVTSASDFGALATFAAGSWLEIKGSNLAATTRLWRGADFNGSSAPTNLDGARVAINGNAGFMYYISPTQINVQAPADVAAGLVPITVTNCAGISLPITVPKAVVSAGMLAPPSFKVGGKQYLVALFQDGATYVGNAGLIAGVPFRTVKPGDSITAYGIGFGTVNPNIAPGVIVGQSNSVPGLQMTLGGAPVVTSYAGLAPGYIGLYQFNLTVPDVPDGDQQVNVSVNGAPLLQTLFLTVHR